MKFRIKRRSAIIKDYIVGWASAYLCCKCSNVVHYLCFTFELFQLEISTFKIAIVKNIKDEFSR